MRRSLIGFLLGVFLVVGGYVYVGIDRDRPAQPQGDPESSASGELARPEWTIGPTPRDDGGTGPATAGEPAGDTGLTIPGSIRFPGGSAGDSVQLRVSVLAVRTPLPESLRSRLSSTADHTSIEELLELVRREGIVGEKLRSYVGDRRTLEIHTNERGEFTLTRAPPGLYRLESQDPVWTGTSGKVVLELPDNVRPLTLDVRGSKTFQARVTDTGENPLEDVRVTFKGGSREPVRTSELGTFTVEGVPSRRPLNFMTLHKPGYEPVSVDRPPLGDTDPGRVTFRMRRGTYLELTLRDEQYKPVTDGAVELTPLESSGASTGPLRPSVVRLDERGRGSIGGLDPGSYALRLRSGDYFLTARRITLEPRDRRRVDLRARRGRIVALLYRDASTGEPVSGMRPTVRAFDETGEEIPNGFRLRNRPRKDRYRGLLHPAAREIVVRSRPAGNQPYRPDQSRFDVRNTDTVTVRVEPANDDGEGTGFVRYEFDFTGPISAEQRDQARTSLYVMNQTTGRVVLERARGAASAWPVPLPSADLLLYGTVSTTRADYVVARELPARPSGSAAQVSLDLKRPATLTGQVGSPGGRAEIGTVGVALLPPQLDVTGEPNSLYVDVPPPLRTSVNEAGRFTLKNLPPDRRLHLLGVRSGTQLAPGSPLVLNRSLSPFTPKEHRELPPMTQ